MFGILYVVATPIGNLEDITLRALRVLKEADFVFAEDTRVTKKLLAHYAISAPCASYHQHSDKKTVQRIAELLRQDKNLALVTDAGTPGISDPGNELIAQLLEILGKDLRVVPVPGPNAALTLASVSGLPMQRFAFFGYPPAKKGRRAFFEKVARAGMPAILYESPFRIAKTLDELSQVCDNETRIVIGRELTKKFETIWRGSLQAAIHDIREDKPRGEYTIVIEQPRKAQKTF